MLQWDTKQLKFWVSLQVSIIIVISGSSIITSIIVVSTKVFLWFPKDVFSGSMKNNNTNLNIKEITLMETNYVALTFRLNRHSMSLHLVTSMSIFT